MARRLTREEFCDRTLFRWQQKLTDEAHFLVRRVAKRDGDLVRFVYDQILEENYRVAFPDASEEERKKKEKKK
jgi:hypothetical protein